MTDFTLFDESTAPEGSRAILEKARKGLGFVPNLYAAFAASPSALEAYTATADLFAKSSFSPLEQQIVLLSVSAENECHYCVAAHTTISQMQKLDSDVVAAVRNGGPISDAKLEALRVFTTKVVRERGWVKREDVQVFLDAGYTKANVVEVLQGVSFKVLSNYLNHIAATPLDEAFQPNAWPKRESVAA